MTRWLADLVLQRPRTIVLVGLVIAIVGGIGGVLNVRFDANTDSLISPNRPFMKRYEAFKARFGDLERIWVVIDAGDNQAKAREVVDWLDPRLTALGLKHTAARITVQEQARLLSWAASAQEVETIADACPLLSNANDGADALLHAVAQSLRTASQLNGPDIETRKALVAQAVTTVAVLLGEGEITQDRYITSPSGRLLFIGLLPDKDYSSVGIIEGPLRRIRAVLEQARSTFSGVDVGLTGRPVIQADEMHVTQADMEVAAIVALVLVSGLVMLILREVKRPLLTLIAFALAVGWTWGFVAVAIGRLTLLSIVFLLVMIGVGLDFGVHVVSRHAALRGSNSVHDTMHTLLRTTIRSNMVAAFTSVAVFLAALVTDFRGLQELGIIAASGILLSVIAMSTILPALLVIFDRHLSQGGTPPPPPKPMRRRGLVLGLAIAAGVGGGVIAIAGLRFDTNLMALQAPGLEAGIWERRIAADAGAPTWFAAMQARDLEHAVLLSDKARTEPAIGTIGGILEVVAPPSEARTQARMRLATCELTRQPFWASDAQAEAVTALSTIAHVATTQSPEHAQRIADLADQLASLSPVELNQATTRTSVFIDNVRSGAASPLRDVLPEALRDASMAPDGTLLVTAHPLHDVWDEPTMAVFVDAIVRVDPEVTGVPITHLESLRDMKRGFLLMTGVAAVFVLLIMLIESRRLREPLVCMGALALAAGWTLGIATLVGLNLNLANFFAVPVLLGLGVDGAIHIAHRRRHVETDGATRRAVLLTSLTTMVGFGSLMLASHRGQASLGALMAIGCFACLVSALWVVPAALRPRSSTGC
jgi:predicted RND superfamily exporter protein